MRCFLLEDDEFRTKWFLKTFNVNWTTAVSYEEAVFKFDGPYDRLFLDHDLGDVNDPFEKTGYSFVKWLCAHKLEYIRNSKVVVHSHNPDGAHNMASFLVDNKIDVELIPFIMLIENPKIPRL
jgi:hypothetical protein